LEKESRVSSGEERFYRFHPFCIFSPIAHAQGS
jgi:hypothetical protein